MRFITSFFAALLFFPASVLADDTAPEGYDAALAEELGIDISRPERGTDEDDARRAAERAAR